MSLITQVGRFSYLARHLQSSLPYLTPRKAMNAILNMFETRLRVQSPISYPPYLKIEPTPLCRMACLGCRHRLAEFNRQLKPSDNLTLEGFKTIVDPLAGTTLGISLSYRGEPMLNRQLPEMVAYAHSRGIATFFPTSLSLDLSPQYAEELVRSGLDSMYVSLDGASPETYSRYRIGGHFETVLANVRLLSDTKKRLNSKHPRLVWKMVIFDHNRHELPLQRERFRDLGFDSFQYVLDNGGDEFQRRSENNPQKMISSRSACFWLWSTMVVDSLGDVSPCCTFDKFGLGNALETDIRSVWRGEPYKALRTSFSRSHYGYRMCRICRECIGLTPVEEPLSGEERTGTPEGVVSAQ